MSIVSNETANTNPDDQKEFSGMVRIEEGKIRSHVDELVRSTVEETLNSMLDAEADDLCGAGCYERLPDRVDTRAGHYERKLVTKAGYRARRWVVERTHSWINRFRRLLIPWEKKAANYLAFLHFSFAWSTLSSAGVLG